MVALDSLEALNQACTENTKGIKKSKKKKKNKEFDAENVKDNQIDMAKSKAMEVMDSQVENLKKKKKKKDKRKEDKITALEEKEEKSNTGESNDDKTNKAKKRKYEETLEHSPSNQNESEDQNGLKSKKKKQKKNKKSKEDRQTNETSEPDAKLDIPTNDDNEVVKKKKKKDKKAKKEKMQGEEPSAIVKNIIDDNESVLKPQLNSKCVDITSSIFKKDFYSHSYLSLAHDKEKEQSDAEQYRKDQRITMYGKGKSEGQFHPIRDFTKLGFEENLLGAVKNFKEPTPIQASAWPVIASGRDTIGIAETGSGKTLAFSIPALAHLKHRLNNEQANKFGQRRGPMMLIVAPTRELAQQSQDVLEVAGKFCGVRSVAVYGGVSKEGQRRSLNTKGKAPFEVVVATPGRLIDLMNEETCDLSDVSYLVLDEADRMLDQGFERDVRKIIAATHPERQTCLFSATWPDSVRELAHEFLKNPVKITIGSDDLTAAATIEQIVEVFDDDRLRQGKLLGLLKDHQNKGTGAGKGNNMKRVLVFVLYKKEATRIEEFLQGKGWKATSIQGDKSQDARQRAVDEFKAGKIPILVATDVAARGLDIPGVDLVINFSFPLTIEDYVHRIGRTGRAGKKGVAYTFFQSRADKLRAGELVKVLRDAGQPVPEKMMSFDLSIRKKEHKLYGNYGPKEYNNAPMKAPSKIVFGDD